MSKLRIHNFAISIDGYGAGPNQDHANPLGVGGLDLHKWIFPTKTFQQTFGDGAGTTGVDDDFAARGFRNLGAWILGRNMFGPVRGPWPDESWNGWWGDNPPYHTPVFVLTHHPRASITMDGRTTFHFITDGIHAALQHAIEAADGKDVRLGGGVATIQYSGDPKKDKNRYPQSGTGRTRNHQLSNSRVHAARSIGVFRGVQKAYRILSAGYRRRSAVQESDRGLRRVQGQSAVSTRQTHPYALIAKIVKLRVKENLAKASAKNKKSS